MKQLVVEKNNPEPILWDTPIPKPGPGEILIKNHYSVVSTGTEIATIESSNKSVADKLQDSSNIQKGLELFEKEGVRAVWNAVFPKNISPIQLGYSSSGKVIEVGRDVKNFHVGDMVVSNGNHAEYVVVNQKLCSRIPEETSPKDAAYTVLGSIALHGLRLSETSLGSRIVVVGLGIVGQLVCRLAEAQGSEVFGIDPDVARRKDNKNFFPSIDDLPVDEVDSIIITAASNSNEPIEAATKIARNKSKIVVVGDIPLNISRNEFYYKELELVVSKSYGPGRYDKQYEVLGNDYPIEYVRWTENRNFEAFLKLLSQGQISIQGLITNEIDFEESPEVYNSFNSEEKPLSVLIRYDLKSEPKIQFEKNDIVPENNQKIKVGVIGAGNFASTTIIPLLKELRKSCQVLGIASSGGLSSETLAKNFKIKNKYSTEDEIFESDEIDAVFVLTQHFNHADLVIKAINAGKAVYVEKPLAIDVDSITRIEEAMYNAEDPKIFLGFNRRFSGASQFIKEKLNTYPANAINFRFSVPKLERDHWTNIKEIGGGRIVGEAIHAIDLGTYFFESLPQSISSHSPINKDSGEVYDNQVFININYTNGSHAAIQYFSDTNDNLSKERLEIHGNDNSFIVEDFKLMRYLIGPDDKSKVFSDGKGHKQTIETFFSYVNNEIPNPYTWLEIKSVSLAGIYAQNYLNSGIQKSIF
jgi:predicted dehydrogenase/threonine dehydrogenase-like Zn-dependent dehydrogenase|tara:strand:- start:4447 stop:6540 length:2094 start_codon:yes stop_codon:yes gene_type:complete